ncbi:MAG: collagen binding domain-containing protein, partial [Candidatus Thorarchaeota archaeon]
MKFDKKNPDYHGMSEEEANALLGKPYIFQAGLTDLGGWTSSTALNEISESVKKMKACAVYGFVMDQSEFDTPVAGATFRLFDSDGKLLKSKTTGEDGVFYFDKLKPDEYSLYIELPLGLILDDEDYSGTTIYLTLQIKLQDGDFISVLVTLARDVSEPEGEPPLVSTSMEQIFIPNDSEVDLIETTNTSFLGTAIAFVWFSSIVSLAYIHNQRNRRIKRESALLKSTPSKGLQWSLEDLES